MGLNSDRKLETEILARIALTKDLPNLFANQVEEAGWKRKKTPFRVMTSGDVLDFPELSEDQLKVYFTGTYQYSQSVSYLAEILDENDRLT